MIVTNYISYPLPTVHWIDVFIREEYNQVLIDSWKHCQENKGLEIFDWCIMTSHVHMIIGSRKNMLEDIVRDTKKHTSIVLKEAIKNNTMESRKEWIMWMMERAGKKNGNNKLVVSCVASGLEKRHDLGNKICRKFLFLFIVRMLACDG